MNMIFGYARVSTQEQNTESQIEKLSNVGCNEIFTEIASGKNTKRPELQRMLEKLRAGDTVIVCSLDRLGRSLEDLVRLVKDFQDKGISFRSLRENIDMTTATGNLFFQMFAAFAEFERNLIRERTLIGLSSARARGRTGGRPQKLSEKDKEQIKILLQNPNIRVKDVAEKYQVSTAPLYRVVGVIKPDKGFKQQS